MQLFSHLAIVARYAQIQVDNIQASSDTGELKAQAGQTDERGAPRITGDAAQGKSALTVAHGSGRDPPGGK